jgi:hypothetical protein
MDDYAEMIHRWQGTLQELANKMDTPEWNQDTWDKAIAEMKRESHGNLVALRTDRWFEDPPVLVSVFRKEHLT